MSQDPNAVQEEICFKKLRHQRHGLTVFKGKVNKIKFFKTQMTKQTGQSEAREAQRLYTQKGKDNWTQVRHIRNRCRQTQTRKTIQEIPNSR